jgi:DNA-binding NarL/FixJ family response regulator
VKVVVVSGVRAAERVLDMYRMGCQGYLMKPIKVESLLKRLSDLAVIT